ncbi:MAG: hypothetical protein AAFY72_11030 [Cyanobacteria bacterium J06649_4]
MNRYMTRRYVAVCWPEAVRLANLDGTPLGSIRCHHNTELLHRTEWWAWWSDERLTTAINLPPELCAEGLSTDAIALMDQVWLGGAIAPQCGWALLARVRQILACEKLHSSNERNATCREKLALQFSDQSQGVLYRCYIEKNGNYQCDIASELPY